MRDLDPDDAAGVDAAHPVERRASAEEFALEPELASVGVARRLVSQVCTRAGLGDDEVADVALVVSELVTNAVLHAGTTIDVAVTVSRDGTVRIEVADGAPGGVRLPDERVPATGSVEVFDDTSPSDDVGALATTGRGIELVATVASRWGTDARRDGRDGKVLWAELGGPPAPSAPAEADVADVVEVADVAEPADHHGGDGVALRLVAVPLRLIAESDHQFDDSLRELQVAAMTDGSDAAVGDLLVRAADLAEALQPVQLSRLPAVRAARGRGDRLADVAVRATPGTVERLGELDSLLTALHQARQVGLLLAPGPSPEVVAFRRWFASEVTGQARGRTARPCPFPVVPADGGAPGGPLSQRRRDLLARLADDVAGAGDAAAVASAAVSRVVGDLHAAFVNLLLVEADGAHVASVERVGYPPADPHGRRYAVTDDNPISEVVRTGMPLVARTPEERRARYPQLVPSAPIEANPTAVWVPIGGGSPAAGTLVVGFERARDFTDGDLHLLLAIGAAVGERLAALA